MIILVTQASGANRNTAQGERIKTDYQPLRIKDPAQGLPSWQTTQVFMDDLPSIFSLSQYGRASTRPFVYRAINETLPVESVNTGRGVSILAEPFDIINPICFFLDDSPCSFKGALDRIAFKERAIRKPKDSIL